MAHVLVVATSSATDAAFLVVFGLFVVAMVVLVAIVVVWAVRHDMAGRSAWRQRQSERGGTVLPPGDDR
jgi:hypothetical protein